MPAQPGSVRLAFPDGVTRSYPCPVTDHNVAAAISPGLAKAALAVRLDGALRDLTRPITEDGAIEIVTAKDAGPEVLELIRHDAAHALAAAAKELYPDVQVTIGPATEDGCHYDIARHQPFMPADLEAIETRTTGYRLRVTSADQWTWRQRPCQLRGARSSRGVPGQPADDPTNHGVPIRDARRTRRGRG